ncbi:MAG: serine hydrolase, partial [Clostridia bacterium]|nr:serine hydrolase [Clostridia bacterium]
LKAVLESKMSEYQGDWSLYYEDYNTGSVISINSHQVYSASLIKLFVAQAVYEKANNGTLSLSPKVEDEIRKMITYSDNDAWKYLARLLGGGSYSAGMTAVTKTAQASGFSDTGQFYQGKHKNFNFTSVNDCGRYLRGILNGTIVSYEYSEKILSLLKQQQHTQKIPAGVPDGIETANKTGELDYVQGDAAIVYAPDGPYILVIIGDNLDDGYSQINKITDLSKIVYEYLNKAE